MLLVAFPAIWTELGIQILVAKGSGSGTFCSVLSYITTLKTSFYRQCDWSTILFLDELVHEKEKFKAISDELDQTFAEMSGY